MRFQKWGHKLSFHKKWLEYENQRIRKFWSENPTYDPVQDQGQFGLHLVFGHKNFYQRSLNDSILIKKREGCTGDK